MKYSLSCLLSDNNLTQLFWNKDMVQLRILKAGLVVFDMMTVGSENVFVSAIPEW